MENKLDAIEEARDGMNDWSRTVDPEEEKKWVDYSMAWSAIAQAEQLKRIADILQWSISTDTYDPRDDDGRTSEDIPY